MAINFEALLKKSVIAQRAIARKNVPQLLAVSLTVTDEEAEYLTKLGAEVEAMEARVEARHGR